MRSEFHGKKVKK